MNPLYSPYVTCPAPDCEEGTIWVAGSTPFKDEAMRCPTCQGHGQLIQLTLDDPAVIRAQRHATETKKAIQRIRNREPIDADHAKSVNYDAYAFSWMLNRLDTQCFDLRALTVGYEPEPRVLERAA